MVKVPHVGPGDGALLSVSSPGRRGGGALRGLFYKDTDPIMGAPPSRPHHLPEAPPPDTTIWAWASTLGFGATAVCAFSHKSWASGPTLLHFLSTLRGQDSESSWKPREQSGTCFHWD